MRRGSGGFAERGEGAGVTRGLDALVLPPTSSFRSHFISGTANVRAEKRLPSTRTLMQPHRRDPGTVTVYRLAHLWLAIRAPGTATRGRFGWAERNVDVVEFRGWHGKPSLSGDCEYHWVRLRRYAGYGVTASASLRAEAGLPSKMRSFWMVDAQGLEPWTR